MLYGLLLTLFIISCFLLILLVMILKGKSGMGIGAMGGSTQRLFGGSGGQDIFQKTTWALGTMFMRGSLGLALLKSSSAYRLRYAPTTQPTQEKPLGEIIKESTPETTTPQTVPAPADTNKPAQ